MQICPQVAKLLRLSLPANQLSRRQMFADRSCRRPVSRLSNTSRQVKGDAHAPATKSDALIMVPTVNAFARAPADLIERSTSEQSG